MAIALSWPASRLVARRLSLSLAVEVGLVATLVGLAACLRFPYLWQIPELTDETSEVWRGYEIYRGRLLPLTNITTFVGPLWNYLMAGLFGAIGPNPFAPRLVVMILGALTIVPTYLLGREIGGPRAGLIAAALLATNGAHIISNSHIAWSNCTTPLFATTGFWLLLRATRLRSGPSLVGSGLCLGLALLTHVTFAFLLPGVAAYLLWHGRFWLRTRWAPLALLAFLLALAPLIAFNLQTGFETLEESAERTGRTRGNSFLPAPETYLRLGGTTLLTSLRLVGGAIDERSGAGDFLLDPKVWVYGALVIAGLVAAWRARQPLPALIVASGLLLWPIFDTGVDSVPVHARYLVPMLPPVFAAIGLLFSELLDRVGSRAPAVWLGIGLLVAYPLLPAWSYYERQSAAGRTNEVGYSMLAAVQANRQADERVLLHAGINRYSFGGNGAGQRAFRYLLELRGINTSPMGLDDELDDHVNCGGSALLIMRAMEFRKLGESASDLERQGLHLTALAPPGPANPVFGLYRVGRDPCPERRRG